jgi:hypothetical protein
VRDTGCGGAGGKGHDVHPHTPPYYLTDFAPPPDGPAPAAAAAANVPAAGGGRVMSPELGEAGEGSSGLWATASSSEGGLGGSLRRADAEDAIVSLSFC